MFINKIRTFFQVWEINHLAIIPNNVFNLADISAPFYGYDCGEVQHFFKHPFICSAFYRIIMSKRPTP